jgi:hypothetical protein
MILSYPIFIPESLYVISIEINLEVFTFNHYCLLVKITFLFLTIFYSIKKINFIFELMYFYLLITFVKKIFITETNKIII